jgi:uncharacterized protein (DUF1499 family)
MRRGPFSGVLMPFRQLLSGRGLPSIHDITTDPGDPPRFSALLSRRTGRVSPPEYDGPAAADRQRRAYPDIVPLDLDASAERAFADAAAAARQLGWEIVAVDPARGVIEATDTTFWFRFKDDIVVRVRPRDRGSRVDIRSKSRIGRGDLGANAHRIRTFIAALRARGDAADPRA